MLQNVCASANIEVGSVRSSLNLQRKTGTFMTTTMQCWRLLSCSTSALIRLTAFGPESLLSDIALLSRSIDQYMYNSNSTYNMSYHTSAPMSLL